MDINVILGIIIPAFLIVLMIYLMHEVTKHYEREEYAGMTQDFLYVFLCVFCGIIIAVSTTIITLNVGHLFFHWW